MKSSIDTTEKVADWVEHNECDGKGCNKCTNGYILVKR